MNFSPRIRAPRRVAATLALALGAAGTVLPLAAPAQATAPVLRAGQVTEDALVDALSLARPDADRPVTTRGIRPSLTQTSPALKPAKPASAGKASLLITFATGSAELTPEGIQVLDTVAKALQSDRLSGLSFRVEGHADPRGGMDLNQKLSAERAEAVVLYLTAKHGITPDRLASVGKGATELLNPGRPDAPENRRVTIVTNR